MRSNNLIEYRGERLCATDWAIKLGMPTTTFFNRLSSGWDIQKIISTPVRVHARIMTHLGVSDSILGWSKRAGIPFTCLIRRIDKGMSVGEAIKDWKTK